MMEVKTINQALKIMNRVEDKRDELRSEYEKQDSVLRTARAQLEQYLLQSMKDMGLQAFELPGEGVASIRVKRRFGAADWSLVWDWIVREKCPEMLQKRLLDTAIQKYLDDTGQLPPGVNTEARNVIVVTQRG